MQRMCSVCPNPSTTTHCACTLWMIGSRVGGVYICKLITVLDAAYRRFQGIVAWAVSQETQNANKLSAHG